MTTRRLHGVLHLEDHTTRIGCDLEALGSAFDIVVGGMPGKLVLPREPKWPAVVKDLNDIKLQPPEGGLTWRDDLRLGSAHYHRPPGENVARQARFTLDFLYMYFDVASDGAAETSQAIYDDSARWLHQFCGYYDLVFRGKLNRSGSTTQLLPKTPFLDLFFHEDGKREVPFTRPVGVFTVHLSSDNSATSVKSRLQQVSQLASAGDDMPLPYQLQLSAYSAFSNRDLRKAIIETASATEVALSQTLFDMLIAGGKSNEEAKQTLKDNQTLGGRARLATNMNLAGFDKQQCTDKLNKPRNAAIHEGQRPTIDVTLAAIAFTDDLLSALPLGLF